MVFSIIQHSIELSISIAQGYDVTSLSPTPLPHNTPLIFTQGTVKVALE